MGEELQILFDYVISGLGGAFLLVLFINLIRTPAEISKEKDQTISDLKSRFKPRIHMFSVNDGKPIDFAYGTTVLTASGRAQTNYNQTYSGYLMIGFQNPTLVGLQNVEVSIISFEVIGDNADLHNQNLPPVAREHLSDPIPLPWLLPDGEEFTCSIAPDSIRRAAILRQWDEALHLVNPPRHASYAHLFKMGFVYKLGLVVTSDAECCGRAEVLIYARDEVSFEVIEQQLDQLPVRLHTATEKQP